MLPPYTLITDDVFNLSHLTHTICDARFWLWHNLCRQWGRSLTAWWGRQDSCSVVIRSAIQQLSWSTTLHMY